MYNVSIYFLSTQFLGVFFINAQNTKNDNTRFHEKYFRPKRIRRMESSYRYGCSV